tara:strand:+ start:14 stop:367 length:354 start_codon:yes stop_codon:yes gene_type:complete
MPATLTFSHPLNVSCQIGDTVYYVDTTTSGGFNINSSSVVEIGIISAIGGTTAAPEITVANHQVSTLPNGAFILFSKDNKANMNSPIGYYCEIKLKNTSTNYSELFHVGVDIFESSK